MRSKPEQRDAARRLRADGASLNVIAGRLSVAKSSVSIWVRDVPMAPDAPVWRARGRSPRAVPRPSGAEPLRPVPVWLSGSAQRCSRCRLFLPLEAFNRLGDRRQYYCRSCFQEYVASRREKIRQQGQAAQEKRIRRSQEHVLAILKSRQCADCGETDVVVLEFDHVRDKLEHVSTLTNAGRSLARIDEEIERCDVVCVNCHRGRTARRAGWCRARPDWRAQLERFEPRIARNLRHAYQHLEHAGCADCGVHDLVVLDFDHEGTKRFTVTSAARSGMGLASIEREISVCRVRCGNGHRRRTALAARYYRSVAQELSSKLPGPP